MAGALVLALAYVLFAGDPEKAKWAMAAVAMVMACGWAFEVAPLGIVALTPLVAYPLLGIASTKDTAPVYMGSTLFIFMGGFFVALAMQRCNLHRRIALNIISAAGDSPARIVLGFMATTWFLSMWISNTATTVMMVSVGLALTGGFDGFSMTKEARDRMSSCLMLAIAYSASVGGMATLVGTPPNLAFSRIYAMRFPESGGVSFGEWLLIGAPCSALVFLVVFGVLWARFLRGVPAGGIPLDGVRRELAGLGRLSRDERIVGLVFLGMAFLWIFRKPIDLGALSIPGWDGLLATGRFVDDGTVAVLASLVLFFLPSKDKKRRKLLTRKDIPKVPWETILLFGGGFALAKGMADSGFSAFLADRFGALGGLSPAAAAAALAGGMSFLTELTSNTASTQMILPILASLAESLRVDPLSLMVPVTLAASCAFMLPAATAPNAIIFSSGKVTIPQMITTGFAINVLGVAVVVLWCRHGGAF